jgi:hypothetical protein
MGRQFPIGYLFGLSELPPGRARQSVTFSVARSRPFARLEPFLPLGIAPGVNSAIVIAYAPDKGGMPTNMVCEEGSLRVHATFGFGRACVLLLACRSKQALSGTRTHAGGAVSA